MFVPRLASDLECSDEIRQRARTLAEQAEEHNVTTGIHPAGFTAACLYKASREEGRWLTQSEAADVANASKATVRAHRDTLEKQVVTQTTVFPSVVYIISFALRFKYEDEPFLCRLRYERQYSDFEELRPTGEASHIPDTKLDDGCKGDSRRQRIATSAGGYPDAPTTTDGESRSCRMSVLDGQTKCRFCLTNHLGSDATSTNETASTTCLGIVHLVIESTTFYGAVAKDGAAANLLSTDETEPAVDDYTLIYDIDEAPARQLAE